MELATESPLPPKASDYLEGLSARAKLLKRRSGVTHPSDSDYLNLPARSPVNVRNNGRGKRLVLKIVSAYSSRKTFPLRAVFSFDRAAVGSIGGYHSRDPAVDYHPHNIVYRLGGKIGRDLYKQWSLGIPEGLPYRPDYRFKPSPCPEASLTPGCSES